MFENMRVGIYGLGLIGGSLAKALRKAVPSLEIFGADKSVRRKKLALEEGVISGILTKKLLSVMDVVFLAIPVASSVKVAIEIMGHMKADGILTDCGSVKGKIYSAMRRFSKGPFFIPGHPIAGTEKSGYENGFPELFEGKMVFLCPYPDTPEEKVVTVRKLWETAGARVMFMDPRTHDHVFAFASHLPHVVAYSLVHSIATFDSPLPLGYSAGGFKDFTRIASSNPRMWTEIMLDNREEILRAIKHFRGSLGYLEKLIRERDVDGMMDFFGKSKKTRDSLTGE